MTEPNSSTTVPNYVAGSPWDNTDVGHMINMLFLRADRAEQQWRDHELMRSRHATIHPSELRPAGRIGSSSNTELSTASLATPEANGHLGPSWRRTPPRPLGTMNLERPDAAITARGAPSACIAFGQPYPPSRPTPSFNSKVTHPRIRGTITRTPPGNDMPSATHRCFPELHSFDACLKHRNAEPMDLFAKPANGSLFDPAARGASEAARTGTSVAGPSNVETTATRTSQRTLSASEIFKEVRECVIEYLGSDVER